MLFKIKTVFTASLSEVMSDLAMLLSNCSDVFSADVPSATRHMALAVLECGKDKLFQSMSPEAAVAWLRSDDSKQLKNMFARFIELHGHRCVREVL